MIQDHAAKGQWGQTPLSLPARLHAEDAARVLGFQVHDIPVLIAAKLLRPLGSPAPNAIKFFATVRILELAQNEDWLEKATRATSRHWQRKNARRRADTSSEKPDIVLPKAA